MEFIQQLRAMTFYSSWPQFQSIYIDGSDVLGIQESRDSIEFIMDFALLADHPAATAPIAGEQFCYHRGSFEFASISDHIWRERHFQNLKGLGKDKGMVMYFGCSPAGYLIYGDFGHLSVNCKSLVVRLDETKHLPRPRSR